MENQKDKDHLKDSGKPSKDNLKDKTAKGLFWGGLSVGFQQLLGLGFGIILGRLLTPDEYGMIAMISVFSLIANRLQNSGFSTALANIRQPEHRDYNAVFWFNILMGAALYLLLYACAPLIAGYYGRPELLSFSRYAFLGFIFSCLGTAQSAYLFKNMMVKQQAKAGMTAVVVSSTVAVVMACNGYSYWSLATQTNVYIGLNTLLLWHSSSWRPSLHIDFSPIRGVIGFSYKLLVSAIINDINLNILNIILGRRFSAHAAGTYNQAYQWNSKCFYLLQGMLSQVSQPVMVSAADDVERQQRILRKLIRFTAFLSFPLLFGFGMVAQEFILVTIKERWIESVPLMQLLSLSGAFLPLATVLQNVVLARGCSGIYMGCTTVLGACQIILVLALSPWGIRVMVAGFVVLNIVWVFVWQAFTWRLTGYTLARFLADIMPFALAAAGVMLFTWYVTLGVSHLLLLLLIRILTAAVLYWIVMKLSRAVILDECMEFVRKKLGK